MKSPMEIILSTKRNLLTFVIDDSSNVRKITSTFSKVITKDILIYRYGAVRTYVGHSETSQFRNFKKNSYR